MTDAPQSTPNDVQPRTKSFKGWLIASLAVNLLLLGVIAGGFIAMKQRGGPFGGMRPPTEDFGLGSFARTLPEARRQEIKKSLREARTQLKPKIEAIADARAKAADLLAADPLDRSALQTALESIQTEEMKLRGEGLTIFLTEAEKLSLEERRALAEMWKKRRRHRDSKPDDDKGK